VTGDGERQLVESIERKRAAGLIAGVLNAHDPEVTAAKVRAMTDARREYAEEEVKRYAGFPAHPLPGFVRERFPDLDLADPSTWPEPQKCTDGRPWGYNAYSFGFSSSAQVEDLWRSWLAGGRGARPCRNRWKYEDSHLCGVHDRPWRDGKIRAEKAARRYARIEEHLDLARQLTAYGIEADGSSNVGVVLTADAARELLRILAEADRIAPL
jgi:hypothetical protein